VTRRPRSARPGRAPASRLALKKREGHRRRDADRHDGQSRDHGRSPPRRAPGCNLRRKRTRRRQRTPAMWTRRELERALVEGFSTVRTTRLEVRHGCVLITTEMLRRRIGSTSSRAWARVCSHFTRPPRLIATTERPVLGEARAQTKPALERRPSCSVELIYQRTSG
jgi:hypothetical protein